MATISSPDFRITTALLWRRSGDDQLESQAAHILDLHCDRLLETARAFSLRAVLEAFDSEAGHEQLKGLLCGRIPTRIKQSKLDSVDWKIRVLVSEDGGLDISAAPIALNGVSGIPQWPCLPAKLPQRLPDEGCQVLVDSIPTPASVYTTHKTTMRGHYDEARSRLNIQHAGPTDQEVLLYNCSREVTEASLSTPYFLRDGVWITPALSSGGNAGVSRRMALEAGLCVEKTLLVNELVAGEMIWLSNAVRGFMPGRLHLPER